MFKYAIIGLGVSGKQAVAYLESQGVSFYVWDDSVIIRDAWLSRGYRILQETDLKGLEALVWSPGIAHRFPKEHFWAQKAKQLNIALICDLELLVKYVKGGEFIGITGTNGKSTTTALLHHLFEGMLDRPILLGGNIGYRDASCGLEDNALYFLEFSSYQLELLSSMRLRCGILLNITPDHLERHGGMQGYIEAKSYLLKKSDHIVISMDDSSCRELYGRFQSQVSMTTFSCCGDNNPSEDALFEADYFMKNNILYSKNGKEEGLQGPYEELNFYEYKFYMPIQNIVAAYALWRLYNFSRDIFLSRLKNFRSLRHRQEFVRKIKNVIFINDSKATNAQAVRVIFENHSSFYWILGGRMKEGGIETLHPYFSQVLCGFLIGESQRTFAKVFERYGVPYILCNDVRDAVHKAYGEAQSGEDPTYVILSPACSSLDQFENFEHRGNEFTDCVKGLE